MFNTPILLIIFNRPETTRQVFERLRDIKPKRLYVVADGPRSNVKTDIKFCHEAREIIGSIDWECELKTNFNDVNLGLKTTISKGISWFFESVERGIILEDDCVPNDSFFEFCEKLLEKYNNDRRVMSISGNNFIENYKNEESYYFSRIPSVWGWATWRRAWQLMDLEMQKFAAFKKNKEIENIFNDSLTQKFWVFKFEDEFNGGNSWAYPWVFTHFINNGLCIIPRTNLVSNIGFGSEATHAKQVDSVFSNLKTNNIKILAHPLFIIPQLNEDYARTKLITIEQFTHSMRLKTWLRVLVPSKILFLIKGIRYNIKRKFSDTSIN